MLIDTAAIWYRLRVLHFYGGSGGQAGAPSRYLRRRQGANLVENCPLRGLLSA